MCSGFHRKREYSWTSLLDDWLLLVVCFGISIYGSGALAYRSEWLSDRSVACRYIITFASDDPSSRYRLNPRPGLRSTQGHDTWRQSKKPSPSSHNEDAAEEYGHSSCDDSLLAYQCPVWPLWSIELRSQNWYWLQRMCATPCAAAQKLTIN